LASWQARHPTRGSAGNRHLYADIVPGQRALTSPNGTFATDDNNYAAEAYERHFHDSLERLHGEQRYRVFANIERISGRFPAAKCAGLTEPLRRSRFGARMTISAWDSIRRS
jgi:5-aminolevulinate synthase